MPGLLLLGLDHPAATALLDAGRGSPHTAASHRGERLDPAGLLEAARADGGAVSIPAGVLAPITPNYSVRDLAYELGLPVVVGVPAGDDLVERARLALLAAHAGGLAVAAVALTGWPEVPDRVLLDERRLLEAEITVVTGADWSIEDFAAEARPAGRVVVLEPYTAWEPGEGLADPRAAGRPALMAALLEIVAAEGPIQADRAYGLYNKASGGKKLTSVARAPLSGAAYWLQTERRMIVDEGDVLRLPDQPHVRVRELGTRELHEVPLSEVTELMRRVGTEDVTQLKREVLETYGLRRLTAKTDDYLEAAAAAR